MEQGFLPVISISQIVSIIKDVLPERELHQVIDHGIWVRHNFELVFNDGSKAFMKIQIQDEWLDLTVNESRLSKILRSNGLPGPETLYLDPQGDHLGLPFIIQSALKGRHLSDWLSGTSEEQWPRLFEAVGETYRKIHSMKGHSSGVWVNGPEKTLPISPNDFYYNAEIMSGSGKQLFDKREITKQEYLKIQSIWEEKLAALKIIRLRWFTPAHFPGQSACPGMRQVDIRFPGLPL